MIIRNLFSVVLICLLALFTGSNSFAQNTSEDDSTITFPFSYFAEYEPLTVNDMLDRLPGIDLILQGSNSSSSFGGAARGLGASSPILIDGKRMAGKANEARSQLDRISADQVTRIEIIRGTSSDLDVQNTGQVVNIVLREAQSRSSITSEVNATYDTDGNTEPGGSLAYSGQSGRLTYLLSGSLKSGYRHTESVEHSLNGDFSRNDSRDQDRYSDQKTYSLNANLAYDLGDRDRIAFNALYNESDPPQRVFRTITDLNPAIPLVTFEREAIPATSEDWEFGGDYAHGFGNGSRLKFLFIVNEKDNHVTRERFISTPLEPVESKTLFLDTSSLYKERIIRSSYTLNLASGQGIELGVEAAQTIQDSGLHLGLPTPGPGSAEVGGLTPIPLPNAFSTVEEIRYEPFAIHNWQINARMSLESSLVAEYSEIEQTGDVNNTRDFAFIKPKFDFRFDINSAMQFKSSLEKVVSQLSFADFSRATNERDDDQDTVAGNPQLDPEESWQAEVGFDYRLPNDGGALNASYFYYLYDNKIGKIDISPSATELVSTNGNVSSAAAYGLITNASVRLGFLGLPTALVTASLTIQESEFHRDPLAPMEHGFPPFDRGGYRFGFRHDVQSLSLNYGLNYFGRISGNRIMFDIDNRVDYVVPSNLSAFVEKVGFAGLTYRLEANNLEDGIFCGDRRRYSGYIRDDVLKEYEYNCTRTGRQYSFKVRGTF
ncbi:MAG: TonB-dependent receptor [Pseudohongiella sp.]|nr:TonB-dependent receptor [Pseudohongiella sp.]